MKRSFRLWAFGLTLLSILSLPALGEDCVKLKTPEMIDLLEGNRQIEIWWRDTQPESLTCIQQPKLGTTQSPWKGNAGLTSGGFYTGACDFEYRFTVTSTDLVRCGWTEVNWVTGGTTSRVLDVVDTDTFYDLSDGITVAVPGESLYTVTDSEGWTPGDPAFHGIYRGGSEEEPHVPVRFKLTCSVGGEVTSSGGSAVIDWADDAGGSGTINLETAGADYAINKGLLVNFPAGSYVAGDTLVLEALKAFVSNDQFAIRSETFEGYQVLRRSVEDRPDVYKVVANLSRCDTAAFFIPVDGVRYFIDKGIYNTGEGVTPDPDAYTVINGFPYEYAVVTYDVLSDPSFPGSLVRSPAVPVKVHPTPPVGNSVEDVYVVPNPYLFRAGWEERTNGGLEGKLQFMNVPLTAEIRIYDTNGNHVQTVRPEMKFDGETQSGRAEWNLRNASGRDIVSGVYIYRVTAGSSEKVGRFIVVR